MYAYIYDELANRDAYSALVYKIEKRLTDLGLNGKIIRPGIAKKLRTDIEDQIRYGAVNIIAVGGGRNASAVMSVVAENNSHNHLLTFGFIPLDEKEFFWKDILGISSAEEACETLLSRRVETFRLSQINHNYFLLKALVQNPEAELRIDRSFDLKNSKAEAVIITNDPRAEGKEIKLDLNIKDGKGQTHFQIKEVLVKGDDTMVIVDGSLAIPSPALIRPCDKEIRIIVGKNRKI